MKHFIKVFLILSIISFSIVAPVQTLSAESQSFINENGVQVTQIPSKVEGMISLTGSTTKEKIKVLVVKNSYQEWFDIILDKGKFSKNIWLTEGKGIYDISIMVNIEGRKYTYGPTQKIENTVDINRFTVPTKDIESDDSDIADLARRLTKLSNNDRDKAKNIYNWVAKNIKYDYGKYRNQLSGNYGDVYGASNTYKTKKGVCYDYATLVAAMGRSIGMQVKVIRGDFKSATRSEYHAWNEIYLSEEDKWINLDATFGYALDKSYFDNADFLKDHIKIDEL